VQGEGWRFKIRQQGEVPMLVVGSNLDSSSFIIYLGASTHMASVKEFFTSMY